MSVAREGRPRRARSEEKTPRPADKDPRTPKSVVACSVVSVKTRGQAVTTTAHSPAHRPYSTHIAVVVPPLNRRTGREIRGRSLGGIFKGGPRTTLGRADDALQLACTPTKNLGGDGYNRRTHTLAFPRPNTRVPSKARWPESRSAFPLRRSPSHARVRLAYIVRLNKGRVTSNSHSHAHLLPTRRPSTHAGGRRINRA